VIRLIRAYLNAGIMDGGVVVDRHLGTPQGGPLSPLLANVLLNEVDKVLEVRGYSFAPRWPVKLPQLWPPETPPPELFGDRM